MAQKEGSPAGPRAIAKGSDFLVSEAITPQTPPAVNNCGLESGACEAPRDETTPPRPRKTRKSRKAREREQWLADLLLAFSNTIGPARAFPTLCRLAARQLIAIPSDVYPSTDLGRAVAVFVEMEREPVPLGTPWGMCDCVRCTRSSALSASEGED